eukprot:TRINITY_DN90793_c0_g1_i1.p1 TRINITY_DN90793_c0_g1~~TRINITY_DN90793_c0_g1_i1.p1  ORF type:complete len:839 (+),score=138.08 TRINITY_DN90793_c0_g1_i1:26-2542(+)
MPTWSQLKSKPKEPTPFFRGWQGTVVCQKACVVRTGSSLDSEVIDELPAGTCVTVVGEETSSGRLRLCLSEPCDGWVTAKFVHRLENTQANESGTKDAWAGELRTKDDWQPLGVSTFFPSPSMTVTDKTPMGRPLDIFDGDPTVDRSFLSPAALYTDRLEMAMWISQRLSGFSQGLGEEVEASVYSDMSALEPAQPSRGPKCRPQVLYIAGVEGTGHHGVMPMILYPAIRQYGAATFAWWRSLREILMKTHPNKRKQLLKELLESMSVFEKQHFIMEWSSWPFGEDERSRWSRGCDDPHAVEREANSGNPGNSVDLMEFVELFQEHADVKVLVLHRNLVSASWSHKEWDDGLVEHAKVLALFNDYLTGVLRRLKPSMWRWVSYEKLCAAHLGGRIEAVDSIAEFLDLPKAPLQRAFRYFKPSSKDAASEMSPANLRVISDIERRSNSNWFHALFPEQQLLTLVDGGRLEYAPPPRESEGRSDRTQGIGPDNPAFAQLWASLSPWQQEAWNEAIAACENPSRQSQSMEEFNSLLSEDQRFLLHKAFLREQVAEKVDQSDIDFSAFSCMHFWIEDRGFGSEVNNLISAAILCQQHKLKCVVKDEAWNSGMLHTYLQAEPHILRRCPCEKRCRAIEVRRDRQVATPGWFAVCKHATGVSFEEKSKIMRMIWKYTVETRKRIDFLNKELKLPSSYVAVHLRRGDKVAGNRKESVELSVQQYAREAVSHLNADCSMIVACTDDRSAAEELDRAIRRFGSRAEVRFRSRQDVPEALVNGHWQASYNSLKAKDRINMTHEFLADVEVMRCATVCVCTFSSNVGRLVALLRDGPTVSMDVQTWTND